MKYRSTPLMRLARHLPKLRLGEAFEAFSACAQVLSS